MLKQTNIIKDFLADSEGQQEGESKLLDLKVFSSVCETTKEEVQEARKQHIERLVCYRKRKDWQAWCEEDDLDLEGERLLAEIKNYKSEFLFTSSFYWIN